MHVLAPAPITCKDLEWHKRLRCRRLLGSAEQWNILDAGWRKTLDEQTDGARLGVVVRHLLFHPRPSMADDGCGLVDRGLFLRLGLVGHSLLIAAATSAVGLRIACLRSASAGQCWCGLGPSRRLEGQARSRRTASSRPARAP